MLKVSNRACIRRLGVRSMRAARTRNLVAVLAIAMTTVLFTSLFTIAGSINYSFQQENFRRTGGDGHGSFKDLSYQQMELLRENSRITDNWGRLFLGMPSDPPFNKSHVEVSYIEPNGAPHYFCDPVEGTLPQEGTNQAATDTHVLALLGVEPKIGAEFTFSFYIDDNTRNPQRITRTFTLSGWWEYDSAVTANHVLLPQSAAEEIAALSVGGDSMTGQWVLNVLFPNDRHIQEDLAAVLADCGFQSDDPVGENYIRTGVNWGYSGAQFSSNLDASTLAAITVLVLLIILTGYLIIYNVFQISVSNDIRFYGLLKTIGTTGKQIKRIIRQQALLLSGMGIPIGLLFGFLIGNRLTPVIMNRLSYQNVFVSFSPLIFIGAALFALLTVFLSCAQPGRMAAKVSPVEAVRYTEGGGKRKHRLRRAVSGASLPRMAWANLGRNKGKTVVTILSLTLAVVLATVTYTFANGFDMDKYLQGNVVTDFIVGHADQFQAGSGGFRSSNQTVPEEILSEINAQGGITESGRIYGNTMAVQQFMPEAFYRQDYARLNRPEVAEQMTASVEKRADGMVAGNAKLYGMEAFPLSKLEVIEGDLTPLSDPAQNAVAAVYRTDDYGHINAGSNFAQLGDTITLRQVTEWGYYFRDTDEKIPPEQLDSVISGEIDRGFYYRAETYEEKDYTVCALVQVPSALSYRYIAIGATELVLGAERFRQDFGGDSVMIYVYNTTEDSNAAMEDFLADYTQTVQPEYDYESKQGKIEDFEGFRGMFLTLGGALSFVIGLVGILNFVNAVLTGILSRKRELAVLQSVGMTGKQLKTMLVCEGLYYTALSLLAALALTVGLGPVAGNGLNSVFWFFTYRLTLTPILILLPVFLLLGAAVPLLTCRAVARHTIVERLREAEC